jgi:hypothetical protein
MNAALIIDFLKKRLVTLQVLGSQETCMPRQCGGVPDQDFLRTNTSRTGTGARLGCASSQSSSQQDKQDKQDDLETGTMIVHNHSNRLENQTSRYS